MTMQTIPSNIADGGASLDSLGAAVRELQGLRVVALAGATAGTKMNIAALRSEDTVLSAMVQGAVTTAGVAEVTYIDVDATGGTFTVTWNGQTTTALAYNITAENLQVALEALSNIAPGDVVVTGGIGVSGGGAPYILTWSASLGNVSAPTTTVTSLQNTAEVQHVVVDATAGNFTVTYAGQTTSSLAFNVSGANFTTAMVALSNVASGDVVVTGGPGDSGGTAPYVLTWKNTLGNVAQVTCADVDLSGGGDTVTPSTDTAGVTPAAAVTTNSGGTTQVGGAFVEDVANITIQSTKASGTLTLVSAANANTCVVNGNTYTCKTTPTALNHFAVGASDTAAALNLKNAINAYEARWDGTKFRTAAVVATSALGVVTVTSVVDGAGNGATVTETGDTITVSSTVPSAVTATFVSAVNTDALTVNGVAFTVKTTPVDLDVDMGVKATDTLQAVDMARAINAYELKHATLGVVASNVAGVVTIAPNVALAGNAIPLVGGTNITASAAQLANGTATGGIKSTTELAGKSLLVTWFNKQ